MFIVKNPLRFYWEKVCSIHYFHFSFEKHAPFSSSEIFFLLKIQKLPQIYISSIINYWGGILILYMTWRTFSLVCVLSIFFSLFISFFFFFIFYRYFLWETLAIRRDEKGNYYFSCFPLPPSNEHSFNLSTFLPFTFTQSICNWQTDRW